MKKTIAILFFLPGFAMAQTNNAICYLVSGASYTDDNGSYAYDSGLSTSTCDGSIVIGSYVWTNTTGGEMYAIDNTKTVGVNAYLKIQNTASCLGGYYNLGGAQFDGITYSNGGEGSAAGLTVATETCPAPPTPPEATTSTSTLDQTQANLIASFFAAMAAMVIVMWVLKKK